MLARVRDQAPRFQGTLVGVGFEASDITLDYVLPARERYIVANPRSYPVDRNGGARQSRELPSQWLTGSGRGWSRKKGRER
jgi:hypothetical protein